MRTVTVTMSRDQALAAVDALSVAAAMWTAMMADDSIGRAPLIEDTHGALGAVRAALQEEASYQPTPDELAQWGDSYNPGG